MKMEESFDLGYFLKKAFVIAASLSLFFCCVYCYFDACGCHHRDSAT